MERRQVVRGDQMRLRIADCNLMQPILVFVSRVENFFSPVSTRFSRLTFWRFMHLFQVCTFICALAGFHTTPFIDCCISLYELRRWNRRFLSVLSPDSDRNMTVYLPHGLHGLPSEMCLHPLLNHWFATPHIQDLTSSSQHPYLTDTEHCGSSSSIENLHALTDACFLYWWVALKRQSW